MFYFADIDEKFIYNTKNIEGLEDGVLVHCQQCIEKNLKGIITKKYGVVNREHNLVKLLETLYLSDFPKLKEYKGLCRELMDFYFSRRYASDDYEILDHQWSCRNRETLFFYCDTFFLLKQKYSFLRT